MEGFRRGPLDLAWSALATNVLTVHTVGFYAILPHEIIHINIGFSVRPRTV